MAALTAQQAYALAKKYTQDTASEFGAVKGASCQIQSIVKQGSRSIVTFLWENKSGEERTSQMVVLDGTPIYVWESATSYSVGDLIIYASAWYRCIVANSDIEFDETKWEEIGSPDGDFDIVQTSESLPLIFTSADRKMYYSIADSAFWLWNGSEWVKQEQDNEHIEQEISALNSALSTEISARQSVDAQLQTAIQNLSALAQPKILATPVVIESIQQTTVEGALGALAQASATTNVIFVNELPTASADTLNKIYITQNNPTSVTIFDYGGDVANMISGGDYAFDYTNYSKLTFVGGNYQNGDVWNQQGDTATISFPIVSDSFNIYSEGGRTTQGTYQFTATGIQRNYNPYNHCGIAYITGYTGVSGEPKAYVTVLSNEQYEWVELGGGEITTEEATADWNSVFNV